MIRKFEGWSGTVWTNTIGPEWLKQFVGEDRMKECKVFERVINVELQGM